MALTAWHTIGAGALLSGGALGCSGADRTGRSIDGAPGDATPAVVDPDSAGRRRAQTGIIFDPRGLAAGDTVGTLVVTRIDAHPTQVDSTVVGTAAFGGTIRLDGTTIVHHEHPEVLATCFEADSASADRLPRWQGDRRRTWFCFTNQAHADAQLAAPGAVRRATIVIDSFTIHRGMSDEVNTARLVRVPALDSTE